MNDKKTDSTGRLRRALLALDCWLCFHLAPRRLRVWWHRLWVRADEFHPSLSSDTRGLRFGSPEFQAYQADLLKRRERAHRRDCPEPTPAQLRRAAGELDGRGSFWFD